MNRFSLVYLCIFSFAISVLSFLNIIYSNYFNLYLNIDSYVYSLIVSFLFALLFLLKKKNKSIYNLGSDEYVSISSLAKLFSYYSRKKIHFKKIANKHINKLDFYIPNIKKIIKELKIKKIKSLNKSIIKCLK